MTTAACPLDVGRSRSSTGSSIKTAIARAITEPEPEPQPPPPLSQLRISRRRPRSSWSLLAFVTIMCLQMHFGGGDFGGGGGLRGVAGAPLQDTSAGSNSAEEVALMAGSTPEVPQKRLHKRHHPNCSFRCRFQTELNASLEVLDWENTCGGNWTGRDIKYKHRPNTNKKRRMILKGLHDQTNKELIILQDDDKNRRTTNSERELAKKYNKAIDLKQRERMALHKNQYNFLPKLNATSSQLKLRHVHRDLQLYVGAFSYLRHAKLHWDYANLQAESVMSADLERLRASARRALCNVEMAINATNRLYPAHVPAGHKLRRPMTRQLMERKLQKFKTPLVQLHRQATLAAGGAEMMPPNLHYDQLAKDALFVKFKFVRYLKSIRKILKTQTKPKNRTSHISSQHHSA
ncbi:uncharacterized protein LOC6505092 [Drosophila ananassae]|uniref:uncharacterized protein LOC6505092 n=1 Tax=Drosophila ananassae TaxID=7217 RepID=UPI000177E861|nr:uncharacterized protein LOC6505092 [Drosophila ananassae]